MATQPLIDIKSSDGTTLLSTSIKEGAKGYFSLMQHDYIVLPLKLSSPIDFKIGSYVDLRGVFDEALGGKLSKIYYVTEKQTPTYNTDTGAYEYQLRLNAYYWLWNNFIFKYTPENTAGEASWSLTAPLDVQMGVFLRNLKALGFTLEEIRKIIELKAEDESGNKRRLELLSAYRMKLSESLERRRKIDEHIGELEWHIRQLEGAEDSFQECPGRLCENCQYKGKCTFFRTDGEMS